MSSVIYLFEPSAQLGAYARTALRSKESVMKSPFSGNIRRHLPFFLPHRLAETLFSRLMVGRHPRNQFGQVRLSLAFLFVTFRHMDLCFLCRSFNKQSVEKVEQLLLFIK